MATKKTKALPPTIAEVQASITALDGEITELKDQVKELQGMQRELVRQRSAMRAPVDVEGGPPPQTVGVGRPANGASG